MVDFRIFMIISAALLYGCSINVYHEDIIIIKDVNADIGLKYEHRKN